MRKLLVEGGFLCLRTPPGPVSLMVSADRGVKAETGNNPATHPDARATMQFQHSFGWVTWQDRKEMQGWERVSWGNESPRRLQNYWMR